ncbi:hypothetical protein ABFV05_005215 [Capra hircus]
MALALAFTLRLRQAHLSNRFPGPCSLHAPFSTWLTLSTETLHGQAHPWARAPKLPRKNNAKSGFPVYCWHAHTDGRVIQGESTSRSAAAGKGRRGGRRRVTPRPLRGVGRERRARGHPSGHGDRTTSSGPLRPAGGFKNGPPDDTSCSEPTGRSSPRRDASFKTLGGGRRRPGPESRKPGRCCRRRRSSRGSRPSAFGGERAGSQRHKGGRARGRRAHRSTATPGGSRSLAPRPLPPNPSPAPLLPHPVRPGGGPPPPFPVQAAAPSSSSAPSPSSRPPRVCLGPPATDPRPGGPGHTGAKPPHLLAPAARARHGLVRPLQSARPPSPSPHPWARPSHSGPGTLAPPPAHSLTGPASLGPAERGRVSTPPAPGRRLRRRRARCRSLLGGRSPATPRVRNAARRPSRIAASARGP